MTPTRNESSGGAPPPRRLTRSTRDRVLGGVAGGLAEYFAIDPVLVRVAIVFATVFTGGGGLIAYLIAWAIIPEADGSTAASADPSRAPGRASDDRGALFWIGLVLIGVASVSLIGEWFTIRGSWLPALLMIGIGVALLRTGNGGSSEHGTTAETPARYDAPHLDAPGSSEALDADVATTELSAADDRAETALDEPTHHADTPASSRDETAPIGTGARTPDVRHDTRVASEYSGRQRSSLGQLTFAAMLIVGGALFFLDATSAISVTAATVSGVALLIVGLGLLVGTFVGRSRGLIVLGAFLVPVTLILATFDGIGVPIQGGVGERDYRPAAIEQVASEYRLGAGQMTLDLRNVDFGGETLRTTASVVFGELRVIVPDGVSLDVEGSVTAGELRLLDRPVQSGIDLDESVTTTGPDGRLVLDVGVGMGQITVTQEDAR